MLKLIRLEWKKNNVRKYILYTAIMTVVLLLLIMAAAGELDSDETIKMYGKSMINAAVDLFVHMSFIIFTGVMLAAFVVGAYENKTINLMFSYPIKRQKILGSKILAVWIFNFIALVCSKLLIYGVILLTKSYTHISTNSIRAGELDFYVEILISSAAMVSISFIALLVGLKMKSSKAAIVTSVIIVCFTQGNIGSYTLNDSLPFYGGLLILAAAAVWMAVCGVETKDVG